MRWPRSCPNEVFVAVARAAKQLVIVHNESKKFMPFVSVEALYETAEVVNMTSKQAKVAPPDAPGRPLELGLTLPSSNGVRDMTQHIRGESLTEIVKTYLCIRYLSPPLPEKEHIKIRNAVPSDLKKEFHEAVSDINGLIVVAAFEHNVTGTLNTLGLDQSTIDATLPVCPQQRISWLCRLACEYEAFLSGYLPRSIQMKEHKFDWIKPGDLDLARSRLQRELRDLAGNLRFEVEAEQDFSIGNKKTRLQGRADIIAVSSTSDCDDCGRVESVWEIKFVSQLSDEHIIQTCTYAYLLTPPSGELPRIILYNVRDGEKREIIPLNGREGLRHTIENGLRLKYTTSGEMEDKEFKGMCAKAMVEGLNVGGSQE